MKIHVLSDLHLEFAPLSLPPIDADVVVLAGDIDVGVRGVRFAAEALGGRRAIYVAGNHEYYGKSIPHWTEKMRAAAAGTNVSVLDEDVAVIDGVRFLGCTLWTDFRAFGLERMGEAMDLARERMTDYHRIRKSPAFSKLTPRDTVAFHHRARAWLRDNIAVPFAGPTVVVTHHAPTPLSNADQHRDALLSAAYVSDLRALMGPPVALWIHGHTHHCVDLVLDGTRIVSNQRGYVPDEIVDDFDPGRVVTV